MKLRAPRLLSRPFVALRGEWDRMAPRERALVSGLAALAVVMGAIIVVVLVVDAVTELSDHNADARQALAAITKHRDAYLDARTRGAAVEARIGADPPQIQTDIEAAARANNVLVSESNELPVTATGRKYVQHDVSVKLRGVELKSLTMFIKKVETSPRLVLTTRLLVKHKYGSSDLLDAELTATAWEKSKEAPKKRGGEKGGEKGGDKGDKTGKGGRDATKEVGE